MTIPSNIRTDQTGLELALEATADLVAAGVPLGDISARASAQDAGFAALTAAVERLVAEASQTTTPVPRALLLWAQSVEKRIDEIRAEHGQLRELLAAREDEIEFWRLELPPRRKSDSTTAALERAGEAMAAKQGQTVATYAFDRHVDLELLQNGRLVLHDRLAEVSITVDAEALREALQVRTAAHQPGQVQPVAVNPAPAAGETCSRCGKPVKVNGRTRSCERCSVSWIAAKKREPLAQSAWVPDERSAAFWGYEGLRAELAHTLSLEAPSDQEIVAKIHNQQQRSREIQAALDVANDALSAARAMIETRDRNIAILAAANDARVLAARDARVRELEAEVERLKAANERCNTKERAP